jgi:hypothetical protein
MALRHKGGLPGPKCDAVCVTRQVPHRKRLPGQKKISLVSAPITRAFWDFRALPRDVFPIDFARRPDPKTTAFRCFYVLLPEFKRFCVGSRPPARGENFGIMCLKTPSPSQGMNQIIALPLLAQNAGT